MRLPLSCTEQQMLTRFTQFPTIGMCVSGFIHILNGNGKHIIFVKSPSLFVQVGF